MNEKQSLAPRVWALIGLTFAFLVAIALILNRDIDPIDDSDLSPSDRLADPAQNPFPEIRDFTLEAAENERIDQARKILIGEEAPDDDLLDLILFEFEDDLKRLDRYASMTEWRNDEEFRIDTTSPYLMPWANFSTLKHVQARRQLDKGDTNGALESALSMIRFGRGFQTSRSSLIHFLVGISFSEKGLGALAEVLQGGQLDAAALKALAEDLETYRASSDDFAETLKIEYQAFKQVISGLEAGDLDLLSLTDMTSGSTGQPELPQFFAFKKNRTILLFAEAYRQMIEEIPLIRSEAPRSSLQQAEKYRQQRWRYWLTGNTIGYILYGVGIPSIEGMLDQWAEHQVAHDLARVHVALERYRIEFGKYPNDLDSLVPRFLDTVPMDQIAGGPLLYEPGSLTISSAEGDTIELEPVVEAEKGLPNSSSE